MKEFIVTAGSLIYIDGEQVLNVSEDMSLDRLKSAIKNIYKETITYVGIRGTRVYRIDYKYN